MTRILFICLGNICRSTMAEFVMKDMVKKKGLTDVFHIASAGTSSEEAGNDIHPGTKQKLQDMGIPFVPRKAVKLKKSDYDAYDYLVVMDRHNLRDTLRITGTDTAAKIKRLLDYAGEAGDIADPWYTRNFDQTYDDITRGCEALLKVVLQG